MHQASGLYAEAADSERTIEVVDDELRKLMDIYVPEDEPLYLMGNSVHFDRSFLARHMPRVFERLHYRQLDVTSVRLWFQLMSGEDPHIELPKPHRAEEDIENSLRQAVAMWNGR
jgi:oligoribonuclease